MGDKYKSSASCEIWKIPGESRKDGIVAGYPNRVGVDSLSTIITPLRGWTRLQGDPSRLKATWYEAMGRVSPGINFVPKHSFAIAIAFRKRISSKTYRMQNSESRRSAQEVAAPTPERDHAAGWAEVAFGAALLGELGEQLAGQGEAASLAGGLHPQGQAVN